MGWHGSFLRDFCYGRKTALADPTNDKLQASLDAYREDVADLDTAKTNFDTAYTAYTDAQKQLTALERQKAIDDAVANVEKLSAQFLSNAYDTIDASTNLKFNSDMVVNDRTAAVTAGTTAVDSAGAVVTEAQKTQAKEILAAAVKNMNSAAMNGATDATATKLKEATDTILANSNPALASPTQKPITDLAAAYGTALDNLKTVKGNNTVNAEDLKAAQEQVVSKFTGPAILSGNTVGVNAAGNVVETASGEKGITITANQAGIGGQISGFNISVSDSEGKVKKSANASLDAFSETVRAQNKSEDNAVSLQVGANANQSIKIGLTDMRSEALGLKGADGTTLNISTQTKANAAINVLDNALAKALDQQTTIGSVESRLEYTQSNLTTASENVTAAESVIRDADMAKEMTEYTKNNVLMQAAQSMLSQANQSASNALSLLQ